MNQEEETQHNEYSCYAKFYSIRTFEVISIDFLHLDKASGGYLLVITDNSTKFTQVYSTRNKGDKTAADRFILRFGIPGKILHDQGKEFDNNLLKQLA